MKPIKSQQIMAYMVLGILAALAAAPGAASRSLGLQVPAPVLEPGQINPTLEAEYQGQVKALGEEIQELDENLTWLRFKMDQMRRLNKPVPESMIRSEAFKASKIKALEASRAALSDYLAKLAPPVTTPAPKPQVQVSDIPDSAAETLKQAAMAQGLLEWFDVQKGGKGLVLKTTLPILFPSGSAVVAKEYQPFLEKVSGFVRQHRAWIVVDGYADINPIHTKRYPSNFELGAIRAANVVHALVRYGADPSMFKVASTGRYRFPDARPMKAQKALERYVNITLYFDAPAA